MNRLLTYFAANASVDKEYRPVELNFDRPIPNDLHGTLFRNGNGRFVHQGIPYDHIFDGDGMLCSFAFQNGKVLYQNKYVRTKEFQEEEAAAKMRYRSFGTNLPGGILSNLMRTRFKNASNTSVIWHGGKLLSLWEGGLPHEINPATLETIRRFDYDGALQNSFSWLDRQIFPELAFSAHPKVHPQTGELYNFGTVPGLKQRLVQYKVNSKGEMTDLEAVVMPGVVFTHDFILTASGKRVYFFTPVKFRLLPMFLGISPPVASMDVKKNNPIDILVLDKNNKPVRFKTDFGFIFHFVNGFDQEEDTIVLDGFMMPDFPGAAVNKKLFAGEDDATPAGILTRFTLNLKTGAINTEILSDLPGELPSIHPQKSSLDYTYVWSLACPPGADYRLLDAIQKIEVKNKKVIYRNLYPNLPGEPLFVPKPEAKEEDDGYLLMLVFHPNENGTYLYILDAKNLEEISKAPLPHNIPLGFHGTFVNQLF